MHYYICYSCFIFDFKSIKNKQAKIYTFEDEQYIDKFLNKNKSSFILFSYIFDPNNDFYLKELSKISVIKGGKYLFIMIHFENEIEKKYYKRYFKNYSTQPKFAAIKGMKTMRILEQFPEKENFSKII